MDVHTSQLNKPIGSTHDDSIDEESKASGPAVGRSIPHESARGHVTGTAHYIEDLPKLQNELEVGFYGSPIASGKILSIDWSEAIKVPGIVGIYSSKDVPGHNDFGIVIFDEPFLATERLLYMGQPILIVAGENRDAVDRAKKLIRIQVEADIPITTIDEAIAASAFLGPLRTISRGDVESSIQFAKHRLSDTFRCGGQEHMYLEPQSAIAYAGEEGQIVIHSSTQNPTEIQALVAEMLGRGMHEVVCYCRRMGGAFGGKESQAAIPAMMAALVANRTGRSARVIYQREEDMQSTGKRHEYRIDWEVGYDDQGRIDGLKAAFFSNGGASTDLSLAVMERSLLHSDNAYFIPNMKVEGRVCFTNLASNTAFRGFGGPQSIAMIENVMESIAIDLGIDALHVRQRNLYGEQPRNTTHYGQIFHENKLRPIFDRLVESSDYFARRQIIDESNRDAIARSSQKPIANLKGLSFTGLKFGISFTTKFLNQGNALVNVYTDGTVQVSTGATEMGQGVYIKIRQVVADEFGIDYRRVRVMATSTEKNNNTSPTAASASMDLNGAAARNACVEIRKRLCEYAAARFASVDEGIVASVDHIRFESDRVFDIRRPDAGIPFAKFCGDARRERIDLGARGFFATPGVDFNRETGKGSPFFYYTQGAAVAEVEVDALFGTAIVKRIDLLIDIGDSINPAIDRGQIVGGFVQGVGWVTNECLVYNNSGKLLSNSPTTYKIPAFTDLPEIFNVDFFPNPDNQKNIRGSKAVGEPPLMLSVVVWTAIKNALSYLPDAKIANLQLPATSEMISSVIPRFNFE